MSKFGKIGDLDKVVKEIRDDVSWSTATINIIRRGLEDGMDVKAAVERLLEVERRLDKLV